ncbi:MAG: hypothetical protein IJ573_05060 [Clostridia bacterium]|nr:hypothetical protein [Clostridia bacterium]
MRAVYLGVWRYGEAEVRRENAADFRYRFRTDAGEKLFRIGQTEGDGYALQNRLKVGYAYRLTLRADELTEAECVEPAVSPAPSPVGGEPGVCTLSNLLKTAMEPVGRVLYIFGGGWNWQDTGAHENARHIGISPDWQRFFDAQDASYTYRDPDGDENKKDARTSFYPYGGFNQYGYAGLDCSGYVGWTVYNTMHVRSGETGFVSSSTGMAKKLSVCGFGEWFKPAAGEWPRLCPGDIVSISGHVYMALGTCADGSVLIAHSTPSPSRAGQPGGGVQIGAVGKDEACAAYRLADGILRSVYPAWYSRYPACLKDPAVYFDFSREETGVFRWRSGAEGGLTDPDGVQGMTAEDAVQMIFGSL